ncbi:hypothetical protein K1719_021818 [Acacia pycnantha]|nr:hypothetical protein K1719_021818 [Acacia pycnantha]
MLVQGDSPFLPDEIITNILKRLQVKTLIRFQCVSKLWKNLVRSPYFITDHLHHTSNQIPRSLFNLGERDPLNLFVVDCAAALHEFVYLWKPSFTSKLSRTRTRIINSCNGLICVRSDSDASSSDTWREIEFGNTEIGRIYHHDHASFNGSIFWVAEEMKCIVSFDLAREVFTFVPGPGLYIQSPYSRVLQLNQKLVLVDYSTGGIHFWEMEEEAGDVSDKKWSWTKTDKRMPCFISNLDIQVLFYVESLVPIPNINNREEPKS